MKKLLVLLLALITVFSFAGCGKDSDSEDNSDVSSDVYENLQDHAKNVTNYVLTTETVNEGVKLLSVYEIIQTDNGYIVEYSYEYLKQIDLNNPDSNYYSNKGTKSGSALIIDGEVASYDGDEIDAIPGNFELSFKEKNFKDAKNENGVFSAKVKKTAAFIGNENAGDAESMTVEAAYTSEGFERIEVNYSFYDTNIKAVYTFN